MASLYEADKGVAVVLRPVCIPSLWLFGVFLDVFLALLLRADAEPFRLPRFCLTDPL